MSGSAAAASAGSDFLATLRRHLAILEPSRIELVDDSAKHAGHAGARGGGHYRLTIVAAQFAGKSTLVRHRLVYAALGELMRDRIHALSIEALTPDELQ